MYNVAAIKKYTGCTVLLPYGSSLYRIHICGNREVLCITCKMLVPYRSVLYRVYGAAAIQKYLVQDVQCCLHSLVPPIICSLGENVIKNLLKGSLRTVCLTLLCGIRHVLVSTSGKLGLCLQFG
jgi:hypothetical protein